MNVETGKITDGRPGVRHWVMLLVAVAVYIFFVAGYLSTRQFFSEDAWSYFFLTLASVIGCQFLLRRLRCSIRDAFPIWILLLVFGVGYFLQFFLLVSDPMAPTGQLIVTRNVDSATFLRVYTTTVLGFLAFFITSFMLLGRDRPARATQAVQEVTTAEGARSLAGLLLLVVPLLEVVLGYVSWSEHIAVMGAENVFLPFRLAGIVYYTRTTLLPALILLLIYTADHYRLRKSFNLGIGLLLLHGVSDALLRSSRSALVFSLLGLLFLLALTGRFTRRRLQLVFAGVLLSLVSFPIVTAYRYARLGGNLSALSPALRESLAAVRDDNTFGDLLSDTCYSLVFRVTGVDSLLDVIDSNPQPLGLFHVHEVTAFFNSEVMNLPEDSVTSDAPSLIGWFYLVGGNGFVLIGIASFVIGVQFVWDRLRFSELRSRWVAQSLFLVLLVNAASDGVLDRLAWSVFMMAISVTVCEWLICRSFARSRFSRGLQPGELMT